MHSPEIVMQSPQVVMQSPDVVMQTPESAVRTNTYSLRVRKSNTIDRDYSPPGQPTKKKPRVVQTTPNKKAPATKRAAAVQNKAAAVPAAQEDPYFQSLKSGKSVNVIIDKWMKLYDESPDQAIVQFLQIIVATCGCQGKLDANMIHNMEMKDIIARLSEAFDEDSGEYPLIMSSAQWKKFRLNFGDLLTLFIIRGKNTQIYDVTLMDSLIQLLTGLADTQIRAFRHTATFAAMKISSAIVDVVVELVDIRTKNARQIDTEKAKLDQMNVGSERLEMLLQQKEEIDSKIDELKSMIQYMFKSIFVHRYRDVVADIRTICIAELGNWIRVYPALFLEDTYLKYIGWSLCDKLADVRLRCVVALLPLYENFELIGNLELFTNKFKDRLASMVMDTESEVAIKACQLLTHIYRAFPALLTLKDCLPIYELVYCNNRQQAVAAAGFVSTKLFSPNLDGVQADNLQLLKDLVVFFRDGQVHNHTAYLVDSFIDSCPMLKDWGSMVKILLANEYYEHDNELISIMSTAVKQAATGEHPPNRIVISIRRGPGAGTEKKDMRLLREERQRISDVFIPTLPRLLAKFIADQDKVSNLLDIFLHLDLEMYSTGRHEQPLNELMQLFERIVEQYSNEEMIKQIGAIFQYMSTDLAVSQFTETARMRLIDSIALQLRHYLEQIQKYNLGTATADEQMETGGMDQEDEANLLSTYRKIIAFTAAIDIPSKWDFWEETIALLNSQKIKSEDLMEKAVLYCFQSLTWNIKRIVITQDFKEETIEMMKRRRDQFFVITRGIMRDMASGVENAFQCQCDLMILFNWKLAAGHDDEPEHPLHILSIRLDRETSDCITNFVLDNVFVEEGAQNNLNQTATIQMLNKRRNILAHYTKLYLFGLLPIINSAGILRFFHQYYNDFGDIFKHLLQECRKMDKVMTARAIIKALIYNYEEMKVTFGENVVDQDSEKFQSLRDLGRRFALSFGVDNIKNRDALALIHHNGIKYALQLDEFPPNRKDQQPQEQKFENFPFFEILQEFSPKLHRQDKLAVLRYLDKNCPQDKQIENNDDIWQTFQLYRSSLAKAEGGAE